MITIGSTTKGHRVWIQGLVSKGITGERYDVTYGEVSIGLRFSPEGKRKVTQGKGGIIDLVGHKVTQWAKGSTHATVSYPVDPLGKVSIVITRV